MALVSSRHGRRGLATIEMALVLPLLLLLTFGVMEYGWLFMKEGEIINAARQGARVAARADATAADVDAAVSDLMTKAGMAGVYTITKNDPAAASPGSQVHVQLTVPYASVQLLGLSFIPTPDNLGSNAVMAKEGPG